MSDPVLDEMMKASKDFCDNFLRGSKDCQDGIPCVHGQGDAYARGYAAQYQHEQNQTHRSEQQHGH
jgi:hypothetical protein